MLTSLKTLQIEDSNITPQLLAIASGWSGGWKELTRLLTHLPVLSRLFIFGCEKITGLGVLEVNLPASALGPGIWSRFICRTATKDFISRGSYSFATNGAGRKPLFLSVSLQELTIGGCPELVLSRGTGGGGLQSIGSLKEIEIYGCPKFMSGYKASSDLFYCCPFPSSLQRLQLGGHMEGMDTLAPLLNLTSLESLCIWGLADDFRCDRLLPLLTQGQLTALSVSGSPKFFAGIKGPAPALVQASKLQQLKTDDIARVLAAPICHLLSSSLTKLYFYDDKGEALSLLTSLQELQFECCTKLRCLPAGLHKLTNLETLEIRDCPAMRSLPKNGLPTSLQELKIHSCTK
ncbi:hypothetical protein VPH35_047604 [Triticum aestivum]